MEDGSFKEFWLCYWNDLNIIGKFLWLVITPYMWLVYGLANSGYSDK